MDEKTVTTPKVFISYSWSNQDYEERVMRLATDLVELGGVDVVIDKWNLPEGADLYAFMESAVVDKSITKVLILSDRIYSEKADGREGGVGRETQIITPKIYEQDFPEAKEKRFIPIVMEKDEDGKAYLPAYLAMRRYIDMSSEEFYSLSFEQLVRTCYGKPLNIKPKLGNVPQYILADSKHRTGTKTLQHAAILAIKNDKKNYLAQCNEYFNMVSESLNSYRMESSLQGGEMAQIAVDYIQELRPLRDEIFELISNMISSLDEKESAESIHSFFEYIAEYSSWPEGQSSWNEISVDHFMFFTYELFLYTVAEAINQRKVVFINTILEPYYYRYSHKDAGLIGYSHFQKHLSSLEYINRKNGKNYISDEAVLLKDRFTERRRITFKHIMQSDLFLFLYSRIHSSERNNYWFPCTLVYTSDCIEPFEIYAKAQMKKHCFLLLKMFDIESIEKFRSIINSDEAISNFQIGRSTLNRVSIKRLIGFDALCTL